MGLLDDKEADFVPLPDFKQLDDVRVILNVLIMIEILPGL
jgi:hypothetical protein